jgi:hypothetical protein
MKFSIWYHIRYSLPVQYVDLWAWQFSNWYTKTRKKFGRWLGTRSLTKRIWARVYRKWLDEGDVIVRVINWRTALLDRKGYQRVAVSACFWIFD